MKRFSSLILLVLYLFIGIYVLASSAYKPHHNWDMIMYIAAAKYYENQEISSLHAFTYNALQRSVPEPRYRVMIAGRYRHTVYTDPFSFNEQLPFYQIRPLYTGFIFLLYKMGVDIVFATHMVSGISVGIALVILYFMSLSILRHPFSYAVPFFALIFGIENLARFSTPDGMAFMAIVLSAYLYLKNRIKLLSIFLPMVICIRTDLILYVIPLLLIVALYKSESRKIATISAVVSILFYFAVNTYSNNPGWPTIFYFTLVQNLTHPLTMLPTLTVDHYLYALFKGLKGIPGKSNFILYCLISLYYLGVLVNRAKTTSLFYVLRSPAASLSIVCLFYVFSHFVLFPVALNRFFVGPYLMGAFSLLMMMTEYLKMGDTFQKNDARGGNSATLH